MDQGFDTIEDIEALINQGIGEIAVTVMLPYLTSRANIDCGEGPTATMPTDFFAHVLHAHNLTADIKPNVYETLPYFLEEFPSLNGEGDVRAICVHGRDLYFQDAPGPGSPQTVLLVYGSTPDYFDSNSGKTEITCIPHEFQGPLLINYATRELFDEIEDGVEGNKVNWNTHNKLFNDALARFRAFIGTYPGNPQFVRQSEFGSGIWQASEGLDVDDELI